MNVACKRDKIVHITSNACAHYIVKHGTKLRFGYGP